MANMSKIIAFEGTPGSGKTTLANIVIQSNLLKNCVVIPQLQINTQKDDLYTSKLFLRAEIKKSAQIRKLSKQYDYILLDRTFFTTLAYCYARSKFQKKIGEYLELLEYFDRLDKKSYFIRPSYLIHLTASIDVSIKRRIEFSQNKKFYYWFHPEFLKYFSEFYTEPFFQKFKIDNVFFLDTTQLSKQEVKNVVSEILFKI